MTLEQLYRHFNFTPDVLNIRDFSIRDYYEETIEHWADIRQYIYDHKDREVLDWNLGRANYETVWLFVDII